MTTPTWKELKAIVRGGESKIEAFLGRLPHDHKTAGALALSVAHWHPSEREWIRETREYGSDSCGLCVQFSEGSCVGCPLDEVSNCYAEDSLWNMVAFAFWKDQVLETFDAEADKLYNVLVDLYRKEWEKL